MHLKLGWTLGGAVICVALCGCVGLTVWGYVNETQEKERFMSANCLVVNFTTSRHSPRDVVIAPYNDWQVSYVTRDGHKILSDIVDHYDFGDLPPLPKQKVGGTYTCWYDSHAVRVVQWDEPSPSGYLKYAAVVWSVCLGISFCACMAVFCHKNKKQQNNNHINCTTQPLLINETQP